MNTTISDSGIVVAVGRSARAGAIERVREFVDAVSRRDLDTARMLIATDFRITVSGGQIFRTLEDFVAFSRSRNGALTKQIEGFDACEIAVGVSVYVRGTMSGSWLDGSNFEGVRFIDRFWLQDQRIIEMQIWSDLAEFRPR